MKGYFSKLGDRFEALPDWCDKNRRWVWAGFILLLIASLPGVMRFEMDLSDEQFFTQTDEVRQAYDRFRTQFGGDDSVYLVYRAKDGNVFSHASLKAVHDLQESILNYRLKLNADERSPLDHIVDITSIINVSYLEPSSQSLISRPFVGHDIPEDKAKLDELRKTALAHPDYPMVYVSKDGQYGALLIRTDFRVAKPKDDGFDVTGDFDITRTDVDTVTEEEVMPMTSPSFAEYTAFQHALEKHMYKPEFASALEYYPVGGPPINAYVNDELLPQFNFWMAIIMLMIVVINWILFRSFSAMIWPAVIIAVSAMFMVAVLGYLDIRMNMMINVVILLILAIGVADAVHILSGYIYFRNHGEEHQQAMRLTYRKSGLAITLTSITTSAGMLALLFVQLIPIQQFGFASAVGVMFAYVLSLVLLPVMIGLWPPLRKDRQVTEHHFVQRFLQSMEHWSHKKPFVNIAAFTLLTLFLIGGALQIKVDTNLLEIFVEDSSIRVAQEKVEEKMGGTMALEVMITSDRDMAMLNPVMLNTMDDFQLWLETELKGLVTKTNSLVDIVKDANRSLNGGKQAFYSIPQEPNVLRQTLFMFDNANPRDRARMVSDDYRKTHMTVVFRNQGTKAYMALLDKINLELDKRFATLKADDPSLKIIPTGGLTVQVRIVDYISWSQIYGFGIALLCISVIMFLVFKSVRVGFLAMFPNMLPILTVFGIMGYGGITLDTDTLLVAPILIGIVVDDTIHFLTHYRALMEKYDDIDRAIVETFREVGQAITFTSVILTGAFICFIFLDHNGMKNFGVLASIAMFTALAGDLLLLPALLKATGTRFRKNQAAQPASALSENS